MFNKLIKMGGFKYGKSTELLQKRKKTRNYQTT